MAIHRTYEELLDHEAEMLEKPWHQRVWDKAEAQADDDHDDPDCGGEDAA